MPKINVYLPDDLAAAVRDAGIPVSPVCQQALAEAVRLVGQARKTVERLRDPDFDPAAAPQIGNRIGNLMTLRLSEATRLARQASGPAGRVQTRHLLTGLLDEGHNLGIRLLQALGADEDELRDAALQAGPDEPSPATAAEPGRSRTNGDASLWTGLSLPARMSIASALEASIDLGHNYLGCEHLVLGLADTPDSQAARVLHSFGVDTASARRAVTTANAGFAHARETSAPAEASKLDEIAHRLDAVERRIASMGT
jgi:ATP-dependent Clp protease ATP-binding subunit ClpA